MRKKSHVTNRQSPEEPINVGQNVFLKNDKSKLKAREMYKVMDIYRENQETWATIQKHNTQFRRKKYEVKTAELILIPGQINFKPMTKSNDKDRNTNADDDEKKPQRKPRRAAQVAKQKIAEMYHIQTGLLYQ